MGTTSGHASTRFGCWWWWWCCVIVVVVVVVVVVIVVVVVVVVVIVVIVETCRIVPSTKRPLCLHCAGIWCDHGALSLSSLAVVCVLRVVCVQFVEAWRSSSQSIAPKWPNHGLTGVCVCVCVLRDLRSGAGGGGGAGGGKEGGGGGEGATGALFQSGKQFLRLTVPLSFRRPPNPLPPTVILQVVLPKGIQNGADGVP